jgi:HEAT repeat protein
MNRRLFYHIHRAGILVPQLKNGEPPTMNEEIRALAALLDSASLAERRRAAEQLSRLGPAAKPAAATLVMALADTDETVREWATAALEEINAPAGEQTAQLAAMLKHAHPDAGYWAATLLGRIGPEALPAAGALAEAVAESPHAHVQERAAWALGKLGPGAAQVAPELERASQSKNPRLARLAKRALQQIHG